KVVPLMRWRCRALWGVALGLSLVVHGGLRAEMLVARIQADYDLIADHNTTIRITNLSTDPLSDLRITGVGYGGTIDGVIGAVVPQPGLLLQPGQRLT